MLTGFELYPRWVPLALAIMIRTAKILELQQQWFRRVNQQHKNTTSNRQKSLLPGHYNPESRDNQANLFVIEFIQMINVKYAFSKLTTAKKKYLLQRTYR